MTMHLHINNPNLEKQFEKFAKEEGQTAEVLVTDVLQRHVEYKERYAKEKIEDEQRWQRYLDTGEATEYITLPGSSINYSRCGQQGRAQVNRTAFVAL